MVILGPIVTLLRWIAATNPCPSGYYGDPRRACSCAPGAIGRCQKRQSTRTQAECESTKFVKAEIAGSTASRCGRSMSRLVSSIAEAVERLPRPDVLAQKVISRGVHPPKLSADKWVTAWIEGNYGWSLHRLAARCHISRNQLGDIAPETSQFPGGSHRSRDGERTKLRLLGLNPPWQSRARARSLHCFLTSIRGALRLALLGANQSVGKFFSACTSSGEC
jgi:hypothetical protein